MTSALPLAAVVLDLDGVVRFFPPDDEARACTDAGLPPGTVLGTAFRPELLDPAISGRIPDERWRDLVTDALVAEHRLTTEIAATLVEAWSRSPGEVEPVALQAVSRWRAGGVQVVLLTNATTRLPRDLDRLGLADAFDAVVSSAVTGQVKPDRAAFLAAVDVASGLVRRRLDPAEVLVVDDAAVNVQSARALGLRAHHAVTRGLLPV